MSPFDAIKYVTSGLTLVAFVVAVVGWMYRTRLSNLRALVESASQEQRADLVARELERFQIDASKLTREQQFRLAQQQLRDRMRRFYTTAGLLALAALVMATLGLAQRVRPSAGSALSVLESEVTGTVGGEGGSPFEVRCDSGQLVVGFEGYAGGASDPRIFQLTPLCSQIRLVGAGSNRTFVTGAVVPTNARGSVQGSAFNVRCPANTFVAGMQVQAAAFTGYNAWYVNEVDASCWQATVERDGTVAVGFVAPLLTIGAPALWMRPLKQQCSGLGGVGGIHGRAGDWIDALGFSCRRLILVDL